MVLKYFSQVYLIEKPPVSPPCCFCCTSGVNPTLLII
ncbi:Uncharacterised protein [Segatella copri]|nr:Uncharacterised protein [Segatella copri]